MTAAEIVSQLRQLGDPAIASVLRRFFKTGPGEYGAGDTFVGIKVPPLRKLAREYRQLDLAEAETLLRSAIHEGRLLALLILVGQFARGDDTLRQRIHDLYLRNTSHVNNWDLVDASAEHIVGGYLSAGGRELLDRLAGADLLWERRIAILATFHFIKRREFADTLRIAGLLLQDRHDLIHKAVGWMLREVGKRDLVTEEAFLRINYRRMPRTMLRYAVRALPGRAPAALPQGHPPAGQNGPGNGQAVSKDSLSPYLWMLLGCFSFAIMGVLAHSLSATCNWPVIALARSGLACLFALLLVWWHGVPLVIWKPGILWVRSLAGSVSMVCTFYSLARLPTADVLTLTNMFPIWVAVLSWPLEGEAPPPAVWVAVLCGVAGVALIQQPHIAAGNWTTLVALISSVFTAVAMLGLHNIKGVDTRSIVTHFSGVSTLFAVGALFVFEPSHPAANHWAPGALLVLLVIGVTATIGQLFLTRAFSAGEPTRVSVVGLSQILFAMLLEALLVGHSFNALRVVGIVLVMGPTAWVMLRGLGQKKDEEDEPAPPRTVSFPTPAAGIRSEREGRVAPSSVGALRDPRLR